MVDAIRRHVRHRVELLPCQRFLKRREAIGNAVAVRKFVDARAVDIDGANQFDAIDRAELPGMLLRHPAGAEYQKTH